MAVAVIVPGKTTIKVGTGTSAALETLGFSRNGVAVEEDVFWHNVQGDENAGDVGPPIDKQYMGQIARVRCEMTKFDLAVLNKLRTRRYVDPADTVGTVDPSGTLLFASTAKLYRVHLTGEFSTVWGTLNFPYCVIREPITYNLGSRHMLAVVSFEAHAVGNVLHNTTT